MAFNHDYNPDRRIQHTHNQPTAARASAVQAVKHQWNDEFCSCGSDTGLCQVCGQVKCGSLLVWRKVPGHEFNGNVCAACCRLYA